MFPKKGKELHRGPSGTGINGEFEQAIAAALKGELGSTHRAINSTASRTVVVGDFHWLDRLAAWALIQGFDEREGEARADCRD